MARQPMLAGDRSRSPPMRAPIYRCDRRYASTPEHAAMVVRRRQQPELAEDVRDVRLDGLGREEQSLADCLVGATLGHAAVLPEVTVLVVFAAALLSLAVVRFRRVLVTTGYASQIPGRDERRAEWPSLRYGMLG